MKKHILQKTAAFLLSLIISVSAIPLVSFAETVQSEALYTGMYSPDEEYVFSVRQDHASGDVQFGEDKNGTYADITGDAVLSFSGDIPKAGQYQIALEYLLSSDSPRELNLEASVNNGDFVQFELPKIYRDILGSDGKIERDSRGNDVKPQQESIEQYVILPIRELGNAAGEIKLYDLNEGNNQIRLEFEGQKVKIRSIRIFHSESEPYNAANPDDNNKDSILIEAEYPLYKSSSLLYPMSDRSSVATTPYHYSQIRLNTIGGSSWKQPGQWITWQFNVKQAGYYSITLRYRQNVLRGMQASRRIYIDGRVPYDELADYRFSYDRGWQLETLSSNEQTMYFYLSEGVHTLSMEAIMGNMLQITSNLQNVITELNQLYLQIIKITGIEPDIYRSYDLDKQIPNLKTTMQALSDTLTQIAESYEAEAGSVGSELSFLHEMAILIDSFIEDPDRISSGLDKFKSNISTLSTLLSTIGQQPLEVDKILIKGMAATEELKENAGFWESLWNGVKSFFASFVTDYSMIGSGEGDPSQALKVWITTGRDQAQILKAMIDDTFTPKHGINVELSLIQAGLVEATMAGKGPDIALGVSGAILGTAASAVGIVRSVPIDLGVRGVLVDLSEYEKFDEIKSRFQETAFNGYTYEDKTFAIPETQDFNVMFVRTDILSQLGLQPPETWDDLINMIPTLSQENMQVGVPQACITTMLLQNGMTYYQPGYEKTVFSTQECYEVYQDYIALYRDYEQPYYFDSGNRFKTGEMPVLIAPYSFFNTITVLAPEIRDLWDIYLVPGTEQEDGTINHATEATGVSSIMFKKCENKENGFTFLDWWSSADTQYRYGQEIENVLGKAGRYATANVEAFAKLDWSKRQLEVITAQRQYVHEIEEIPGSYIIARNMNNIFLDIINNGANIRESLVRYSKVMDEELVRKRLEIELLEKQ